MKWDTENERLAHPGLGRSLPIPTVEELNALNGASAAWKNWTICSREKQREMEPQNLTFRDKWGHNRDGMEEMISGKACDTNPFGRGYLSSGKRRDYQFNQMDTTEKQTLMESLAARYMI